MKKKIIGNMLVCLWLAMSSYALFPLGTSIAGLAIFCFAVLVMLGGWFRTQQWPVWKEILLIVGSGILGMLARWLLEYGEVWWQENFTAENTVRHVVALAVCGGVLSFLLRHLNEKKIS